jgi:hypothetical protein
LGKREERGDEKKPPQKTTPHVSFLLNYIKKNKVFFMGSIASGIDQTSSSLEINSKMHFSS